MPYQRNGKLRQGADKTKRLRIVRQSECRNEATKQRKLPIEEYWRTKSEDLKRNPREFFRVFKPFLKDKGVRPDQDIELNIMVTL